MKFTNLRTLGLVIILLMFLSLKHAWAQEDGLILWNKLGNDSEVTNSEIGENGVITTSLNYAPVQFDNGMACPSESSLASFYRPFDQGIPENGTIEFWWIPQYAENYRAGFSHYDQRHPIVMSGGDLISGNWKSFMFRLWTGTGRLTYIQMVLRPDHNWINHDTKGYDLNFQAKQKMHVAITWDSAHPDFMALFINGVKQTPVNRSFLNTETLITNLNSNLAGKPYYMYLHRWADRPDGAAGQVDPEELVDNLKIWNYAKTNFDDRFIEDFPKLILWNKMGSESEVANSEIGSAFIQAAGTVGYSEAKFGNGHNDNGSAANYLEFEDPNVITKRDAWTIEFWAKYDQGLTIVNGIPVEWSIPHILTSIDAEGSEEIAFIHRAAPSHTYFSIFAGNNHINVTNSTCNIATDDLVHWALVYDVNGIQGTTDKIRLYYYNETSGQTSMNAAGGTFNGFTKDWVNIRFGRSQGQSDDWRPHMTIDNLKIYNYAKTNFEDRFIEGIPVQKTITLLNSTGEGLAGGTVKYYASGWKDVPGQTGSDGRLTAFLQEGTTPSKWKMYYAGASRQKDNTAGDINFQTVNVSMDLKSSTELDLNSSDAKYYASGWKQFGDGTTPAMMELLPGNYNFKVYYQGGSLQKSQDVDVDPVVGFKTVHVSTTLKSSDGVTDLTSDDVKYYASGWKQFGNGTTPASMELLPNTYKFKVYYLGGSMQSSQNIEEDPNVAFQTMNVTMALKSSTMDELNSDDAKYYAGGWKQFGNGTTPTSMEMLPNTYKFKVYYLGASNQISQDISSVADVTFETQAVTMNLNSSSGGTLISDDAKYYASGWKSFEDGNTPAIMEMLPNSYKFKVYYGGGSKQIIQDIESNANIVFETGLVTMNLFSSTGGNLVSNDAKYYASGWKTFGDGTTTTSMELLPNTYKFKVYYAGGSNQKTQAVVDGSMVEFSTTEVMMTLEIDGIPESSSDAKYYASGWKTFGSGITETSMELLPNNYQFKVYFDGTSEQKSQDVGRNPFVDFSVSNSGARIASSTTNVERRLESKEILIYPNPVKDFVMVELPEQIAEGKENIEIHLFNLAGKDMIRENLWPVNKNRMHIDMNGLPSGLYILAIPNETMKFEQKIIKR